MSGGVRRPGRPRRNNAETPGQGFEWMEEFMHVVRDQTIATNNLLNHHAQARGPTQPQDDANRIFIRFHKLNPPEFSEARNALDAQHWLEAME